MMPSLFYPYIEDIQSKRFKIFYLPADRQGIAKLSAQLEEENVPVVDMGKTMANYLIDKTSNTHIDMEAEDFLRHLLRTKESAPAIALCNLGILLEPSLRLNAVQAIQDASKDRVVLILWEGEVESEFLYWNKAVPTYGFHFAGSGIKPINLPNEI